MRWRRRKGAMARCIRNLGILISFAALSCAQTFKSTSEYINAPVNLTISLIATQTYELSFYSDNREGGASGYGIFVDPSYSVVNTTPVSNDINLAQMFCNWSSQAYYAYAVNIQVGAAATGIWSPPPSTTAPDHNSVTLCTFTTKTLASGNYVGLRARVERTEKPWSAAAIVQVP